MRTTQTSNVCSRNKTQPPSSGSYSASDSADDEVKHSRDRLTSEQYAVTEVALTLISKRKYTEVRPWQQQEVITLWYKPHAVQNQRKDYLDRDRLRCSYFWQQGALLLREPALFCRCLIGLDCYWVKTRWKTTESKAFDCKCLGICDRFTKHKKGSCICIKDCLYLSIKNLDFDFEAKCRGT